MGARIAGIAWQSLLPGLFMGAVFFLPFSVNAASRRNLLTSLENPRKPVLLPIPCANADRLGAFGGKLRRKVRSVRFDPGPGRGRAGKGVDHRLDLQAVGESD